MSDLKEQIFWEMINFELGETLEYLKDKESVWQHLTDENKALIIQLAATPDAVDKNDLLPDVSDIIKCDDCGGELYYDETNKYYVCKECKTTQ
jgi:hypothetical protein